VFFKIEGGGGRRIHVTGIWRRVAITNNGVQWGMSNVVITDNRSTSESLHSPG
jgi:hypothetical protein